MAARVARGDPDPRGRIRGVRFNNRSTRPLRLPSAEVTACYAAYRRWATLLARPERTLTPPLRPGDCLVFDNTRIRHGRTAFTGPASVCCRAATRTWTGWPVRWRYERGWRRERPGHHR